MNNIDLGVVWLIVIYNKSAGEASHWTMFTPINLVIFFLPNKSIKIFKAILEATDGKNDTMISLDPTTSPSY